MPELSQHEVDTLANYAVRRGHTWKARLLASWEHGVPASMESIHRKLGTSGVKSIDTERLIASASRAPRSALDMSMARFNPSPERSPMARKFAHTARYHVNKGGRVIGYHRSYTLALKHRRRLGKGARIVDTQGFDVLEGAALKKYRATAKKGAKRTAKKGCACPPKRKAATRRNPSFTIYVGDRVTIRTPHGQLRSGKAVMMGPNGWVLNMGGPHGTPGIANENNIVKVEHSKRAAVARAKGLRLGLRRNPQSMLRRLQLMPPGATRTIAGAKVTREGYDVFELSWRGARTRYPASGAAKVLEVAKILKDREARRATRRNPGDRMTGKFRVHTGPTQVAWVASTLRKAGATDITEGTEHVLFSGDARDIYDRLSAANGWMALNARKR